MCPHPTDDAPANNVQDMVAIENKSNGHLNGNGTTHRNGTNGHSSTAQRRNPYAPRASDFLNNVSNFKIIESTLRGICFFFHPSFP